MRFRRLVANAQECLQHRRECAVPNISETLRRRGPRLRVWNEALQSAPAEQLARQHGNDGHLAVARVEILQEDSLELDRVLIAVRH